jgi:hypothetical protein
MKTNTLYDKILISFNLLYSGWDCDQDSRITTFGASAEVEDRGTFQLNLK